MKSLLIRSVSQARYLLLGALTLLCGFQILIVAQAAEIQSNNSFGRMADLVPQFLQRNLGSKIMVLATFKGTVAFGYFHPVVCILVSGLAMYFTTEIAHEVESGLVDLELARPMPRHRLLTRSLLLAFALLVIAAGVMSLGTWYGGWLFDASDMGLPTRTLRAQLLVNLLAVSWCLATFALFVATLSRRWMTAYTIVMLVAIVTYMIDFLAIGWRPIRAIAWISPFYYFLPLSIIAGDAPIVRNLIVLGAASSVFIVLAYWQFQRRDL